MIWEAKMAYRYYTSILITPSEEMWGAIKEWTRTVSREAGSGETRPSQLFADTAGLWCSGPSRVTTDEHDAEYSVMHCITEEKTVTLTHTHTHTGARARR